MSDGGYEAGRDIGRLEIEVAKLHARLREVAKEAEEATIYSQEYILKQLSKLGIICIDDDGDIGLGPLGGKVEEK